jgi:hypothetical protein
MHASRGHSALDVFGNFTIEKTEERIASIDQMHFDAESSKSAGILRADHARADNRQSFRQHADLENLARIVHAGMLEGKLCRAHRRRAGGDKNSFAMQQRIRSDTHGVGIDKTRRPETSRRCRFAFALPSVAFVCRNGRFVAHEIRDRRLSPEREIHAKELARTHAREGQRGFAQGLARDRTRVDPSATNFAKFFDERDALAKNPRRIRSANSCRSAADYDEIEGVVGHSLEFARVRFFRLRLLDFGLICQHPRRRHELLVAAGLINPFPGALTAFQVLTKPGARRRQCRALNPLSHRPFLSLS